MNAGYRPETANDIAILVLLVGTMGHRSKRKRLEDFVERCDLTRRGLTVYEVRNVLRECGIRSDVLHLDNRDPMQWAASQVMARHTPLLRVQGPDDDLGPFWAVGTRTREGGAGIVLVATSQDMRERILG